MIHCHSCGQPIKIGQAELTGEEKSRVDWAGPPQNGRPNIIEAKVVKAYAIYYGVDNWMKYWDQTLSPEENAEIFRKVGTPDDRYHRQGPTMRELRAKEVIRTGIYDD